ncbi:hypothetical protein [Streptomyces spiramyceticus]|uniref:hypothetical protein n=1 Tax=Streptomyces spiramyceticus TaxID=299717 RepID=UPI00237BCEE6|nr:hypothetical protein [Streptomyces spiramyceticus]
MHMWKRLARMTVVAGSAAALVTGLSTSAQAASGTFAYNRADTGFRFSVTNPPDNLCIPLEGGAGVADNFTDTRAILFRTSECTVAQDTLFPNEGGVYGGATVPHSVMFIP